MLKFSFSGGGDTFASITTFESNHAPVLEEFGLIEIKLSGLIEYDDSQSLIFFLNLKLIY